MWRWWGFVVREDNFITFSSAERKGEKGTEECVNTREGGEVGAHLEFSI